MVLFGCSPAEKGLPEVLGVLGRRGVTGRDVAGLWATGRDVTGRGVTGSLYTRCYKKGTLGAPGGVNAPCRGAAGGARKGALQGWAPGFWLSLTGTRAWTGQPLPLSQ